MRPVLLELDGFASYRTRATVDFRDADFFVFVGATGSGKSTVIDAMVFALYGTVPRWDDRNAVAPALAPTVNRGLVRLIFDAGGKRYGATRDVRRGGGRNRAVTVREARLEQYVSADALGAPDDEIVPIATGRAVSAEVEKILGLNFEQFTQSVALPQGDFARFLHATDAERQAILKNLLGYHVYDRIQSAAYSRAADASSRSDTLAEQLAAYLDATEESVDAQRSALEQLCTFRERMTNVDIPALKDAVNTATAARISLNQLTSERDQLLALRRPDGVDALDAERRTRAADLDAAADGQAKIEGLDKQVRDAVQAATPRHDLERMLAQWRELGEIGDRLPHLSEAAKQAQASHRAAEDKRVAADSAVKTARQTSTATKQAADERRRVLDTIRTHLGLVETLKAPSGIGAIAESLRDATDSLSMANAKLADCETAQQAKAAELNDLPAAVALAAAESCTEDILTFLEQDIAQAAARDSEAAGVEHARIAAEAAAQLLSTAEQSLRDAEHADQAAALRADVHVGDECPVCRQVIVDLPIGGAAVDLDEQQAAVRAARAASEKRRADATRLEQAQHKAIAVRSERLKRCESVRSTLVGHLSDLGISGSLHVLTEPVAPEPTSERLAALIDETTSARTLITQAKQQRSATEENSRTADAAVNTARQVAKSAEATLHAAQQQSRKAHTALLAARDKVSALEPPQVHEDVVVAWHQLVSWAHVRRGDLTEQVSSLTPQSQEADAAAERAHEQLTSAEAAADVATSELTNAALAKQKADHDLEAAERRKDGLVALLAQAPSATDTEAQLEQVKALHDQLQVLGSQLTEARTATTTARGALAAAESAVTAGWQQLRRLRDPLAGFGAPEITGEDLACEWDVMLAWAKTESEARSTRLEEKERLAEQADAQAVTAARALIGGLENHSVQIPGECSPAELADRAPVALASAVATTRGDLGRAEERLAQSEKMRADASAAKESAEVAQMLSNLMRANNFPRWLISSALDALLQDASNILLELSGGQFELTRDERDLLVIDHGDADMSRLVKTLSGGETFQASLALALALSEQVTALSAAGASKLEAIFLDEGFGTLDEATLDVVAGTLENLASSGSRMVGVITHVPALAERIPVQFSVNRDSAGSHIERVRV